jgi:hypothetical protein
MPEEHCEDKRDPDRIGDHGSIEEPARHAHVRQAVEADERMRHDQEEQRAIDERNSRPSAAIGTEQVPDDEPAQQQKGRSRDSRDR